MLPLLPLRMMQFTRLYKKILEEYDVILSPALGHEPPEIGYLGPELPFELAVERLEKFVSFTPPQNVTGTPAISLPSGHQTLNGLPVAIQFAAALGQDKTLLELAFEMEETRPWPLIG